MLLESSEVPCISCAMALEIGEAIDGVSEIFNARNCHDIYSYILHYATISTGIHPDSALVLRQELLCP